MWILPSSIASACAADQASSTSQSQPPSNSTESQPALWVTVSARPRLAPCSDRVWKTRPWSTHLFGAGIWKTSQQHSFTDWWTQSLRASRASRTASPGHAEAATTSGTCSRQSSTSPTQLELPLSSWKTWPGSNESSLTSSRNFFSAGGSLNGALYGRAKLEPLTAANAGSAWPTANTSPAGPNAGLNRGGGVLRRRLTEQCLERRATGFWPTARAEMADHPGRTTESGGQEHLETKSVLFKFWPTASARDWKDTDGMAQEGRNPDGSLRKRLDQLPRRATLWATATANCTTGPGTQGRDGGPNLQTQASTWQTATTQDANGRDRQNQRDGSVTLSLLGEAIAFQSSLPAQSPQNGDESSTQPLGSLQLYRMALCSALGINYSESLKWRLNPLFAAWLLGWHPLWPALVPICSESSETA